MLMAIKYVIPEKDKTTVTVSRRMLLHIKVYAMEHDCSVNEATWRLLGIALAHEEGIEFTEDDLFNRKNIVTKAKRVPRFGISRK